MINILDKIQLLHFFLISYLISRLFIRYKLPERFVYWLFEEKHISISRLTLIIIATSAVLSMIMANVITLLAILPVIILLQQEFTGTAREKMKFSTLIMLAAIWGSNIGGMGMLTGTPTNGVFIGMLETHRFPISASFTFLSWLIWGIPLMLILCIMGWLILKLVFSTKHYLSGMSIRARMEQTASTPKAQKITILLALFFVLSSAMLSLGMSFLKQQRPLVYGFTVAWTVLFLWIFFGQKFRLQEKESLSPLLLRKDIFQDFPARGLLWILIGAGVTTVLYFFGVPNAVASVAVGWIQADYSLILLLLIIGLVTTFTTEIVSNSVIQIAMFLTLFPLSRSYPEISMQMMLIITLTSTCAFMSPIATPSNSLGFGSIKGISLRHMLLAGLVMNLTSALLIVLWVHFVVPVVLAWFA